MRITRLVAATLVAGSMAFGFSPIAHAADAAHQTVTPSVEAWFRPNPTCQLATGCVGTDSLPTQPPTTVPSTPFPTGSLHVAVSGGEETARTYLSFTLPLFDATLTAASLDVPLDTAPADGSVSPERSEVRVCSFQGPLTAANGSVDNPPTADCTHRAEATYVSTATPKLHVDLTPLLSALSSGAGLVLLPGATAQTDAWHVVFSAHDRTDAAKTPPATMTVTLAPTTKPTLQGHSRAVQPPSANPPSALGTVTVPGVPAEAPQAPTVANPAPQAVPQARMVTVGYAYPAVWLLPLALLLTVPIVARTLTRDLTPIA